VLGVQRGLDVEAPVFPTMALARFAIILRLQFETKTCQQAAKAEFSQHSEIKKHGKPPSEVLPGSAWEDPGNEGQNSSKRCYWVESLFSPG
jgi:hypothetical protein